MEFTPGRGVHDLNRQKQHDDMQSAFRLVAPVEVHHSLKDHEAKLEEQGTNVVAGNGVLLDPLCQEA